MHDDDAVSANAQVPAPRIDDLQPVRVLFAHVAEAQLIQVQEFDNLTFQKHKKRVLSFEWWVLESDSPPWQRRGIGLHT